LFFAALLIPLQIAALFLHFLVRADHASASGISLQRGMGPELQSRATRSRSQSSFAFCSSVDSIADSSFVPSFFGLC
jgi:hypothetical protein